MPFTSEKRKEYSSTILSKINSLKQDEKSIESQQQSAIDNYDDSTSNDYSNRKLMIDSQSTLTGAARELCCISNYKIDYSTKNTSFIKNGYVNIGKYITNYPYDVYRFDSPYFFSVLEKYSASRVKGVINNSNGIYQGNMITPDSADESLAPIIGSPSEMSSEFVKYNESGNKNNTIEDSIGAVTEILDSAASSGTLNGGIDYSSEDSYKILKFMGDNKEYPTFKCYGSGTYSTKYISIKVDKDDDCVSNFPKSGSYIICSNKDKDYYQLAKILSITNSKNNITNYIYNGSSNPVQYITYEYILNIKLKVVTNNSPYYYVPKYDDDGNISEQVTMVKDVTLYPYMIVPNAVINSIVSACTYSTACTVSNALNSYKGIDKSCRITQYDPESNYKGMINAIMSVDATSSESMKSLKNYLIGMYNGFLNNRKNILLDTIKDTMYSEDLISSINSRLDKGSGSLIEWYNDLLSTDDMYKRYLAKISSNYSYFRRMGVLSGKVDTGKEVFHSTSTDGTEKIEVSTYSEYSNSKGSTSDEVTAWMNSNPDNADAPYYIYCEKSFNEYYAKSGVYPSLNVGDVIYIVDDSKQETKTTVASISYDKIPSGASINGTSSSASTTYEDVMRIKCTNVIPSGYTVDNGMRVIKEL